MKHSEKTNRRVEFLLHLLKESGGRAVPIKWLHQQLVARGEKIKERTVVETLRIIQKNPPVGFRLSLPEEGALFQQIDQTPLEEREGRRAPTKSNLGALLWHYLLKFGSTGGLRFDEPSGASADSLERKMGALQQKSNFSLIVDAGSTTRAVIGKLLDVETVPIHCKVGTDGQFRLIVPTITTNSLAIADVVTKSKHRKNIEVRMIGGNLRVDRGSICGTLTEMCLDEWSLRGDLAVIGTTGYKREYPGPAFGCDDISESRLKASLLRMAWLRVVVFDSSKLVHPEVSSLFAPLSKDVVDLVVTDDGREIGAQDSVHEFCKEASLFGVSTLILQTSTTKKSE